MRTLHLFAIAATLTFLVGCDKKDTDGYSGLICASDFGSNRATFYGLICATLKRSNYLAPKKGMRYGK